jgi:hypothetical protein
MRQFNPTLDFLPSLLQVDDISSGSSGSSSSSSSSGVVIMDADVGAIAFFEVYTPLLLLLLFTTTFVCWFESRHKRK